eukprot:m.70840 g.70840  ORF g.70840 m.70840 type:complete len:342 (-) comp8325_c0_seq2:3334-4359(-)
MSVTVVDGGVVGVDVVDMAQGQGLLCASVTNNNSLHLHEVVNEHYGFSSGRKKKNGLSIIPLASFSPLDSTPTDVKFLTEDTVIVGTQNGQLFQFNIETTVDGDKILIEEGLPQIAHQQNSPCTSVSVYGRNRAVAVTGSVLKIITLKNEWSEEKFGRSHCNAALLSSDFMDVNTLVTGSSIGVVEMWDRRDSKKSVTVMQNNVCEDGSLQVLNGVAAHSLDGNVVASGDDEGLLVFWDKRQPSLPLAQIQPHTAPVWDVKFSQESPHVLFSAAEDGQLLHWNANPSQAATKTTFTISNNNDDMVVTDIANASTQGINAIATTGNTVICGDDDCKLAAIIV